MTIFRKSVLFLLAVCLFLGCGQTQSGSDFRVKRVIDGDTVELENGQTVRYLGIDTPETRRREGEKWVYDPDAYAEEAKEFNRKMVEGKSVRLEFDLQRTDKYKRLLAYCFVDADFVNARLLEEGYALLYTSPPNVKYADILVKKQEQARRNNKGLWAEIPLISPQDALKYLSKIVTVEGKVSSVYQSPKVVILNFGRSNFKSVIFKTDFSVFMAHGVSLAGYKGRVVRITGKVKEYKDDFEIIIRHPSDIETVE